MSSTQVNDTSQNSHSTVRIRHASFLCRSKADRGIFSPQSHPTRAAGQSPACACCSVRCMHSPHAVQRHTFREQNAMCISSRSSGTSAKQFGQAGMRSTRRLLRRQQARSPVRTSREQARSAWRGVRASARLAHRPRMQIQFSGRRWQWHNHKLARNRKRLL